MTTMLEAVESTPSEMLIDPFVREEREEQAVERICREALYMRGLSSVSPLGGREILYTKNLSDHLTEGALHQWRVRLQLINLRRLCEQHVLPNIRTLTPEEKKLLDELIDNVSMKDAESVAKGDHFGNHGRLPLEHDVKASEYHVRHLLEKTSMRDLVEFAYFPFTSEDINNCAYNKMLDGAVNAVWLPEVLRLCNLIAKLARENADQAVLGLTHGQPASPTTMGKRFAEFLNRMTHILKDLSEIQLDAKCSGPVGNHNAITLVCPELNYPEYAKGFVRSLGFEFEPMANQRGPHLQIVKFLQAVGRLNTVLGDFCDNIWQYNSRGWVVQRPIQGQVGSSVMPQKVNPWRFEVASGYIETSNALIDRASQKLIKSLYERDLTDHPWERLYGEIIGYSLIAFAYVAEGLEQVEVARKQASQDVNEHPEVLAEAIQIAGRLLGDDDCYQKMKDLLRGKKGVTLEEIRNIIRETLPDSPVRERLLATTPETYTGVAKQLTEDAVQRYEELFPFLVKRGLLHRVPSVKAVVFDCDNTLVNTKKAFAVILGRACEKVPGAVYDPEVLETAQKTNCAFEELFSKIFPQGLAHQMLTEYRAIAAVTPYESCLHGREAVHFFARRGVAQIVLTNRVKMAEQRLNEAGYTVQTFLKIVSPDKKKPSPEAYAETWQLLKKQQIDAENVISIGDHIDDYQAASSAGVKEFYAVLTGFSTRGEFEMAGLAKDHIFKDLGELLQSMKHTSFRDSL